MSRVEMTTGIILADLQAAEEALQVAEETGAANRAAILDCLQEGERAVAELAEASENIEILKEGLAVNEADLKTMRRNWQLAEDYVSDVQAELDAERAAHQETERRVWWIGLVCLLVGFATAGWVEAALYLWR